jgi:hypothetical protein
MNEQQANPPGPGLDRRLEPARSGRHPATLCAGCGVYQSVCIRAIRGSVRHHPCGRESLTAYFRKGLQAYPDLRFELIRTLIGVDSLLLYYRSVTGLLAAEMMLINGEGQIQTVRVHYVKE